MALPKKLKAFNLFNDGANCVGEVTEIVPPKLTRKSEDYRSGGMNGPIKIDQGQEAIVFEWTCGGLMKDVLKQYGIMTHDGVQLRFAGAYQAEDATRPDAVEIVVRGRHTELDFGTGKAGDDTAFKIQTACSYYKLSINNETIIEIDMVGMTQIVNGEDVLLSLRTAIGLA